MAKKVIAIVKLQIPAGSATPAPPVGPALGQHGVNIMEFCKAFNAETKNLTGLIVPAVITMRPVRFFVSALNALQNSHDPCCPSAGPTGGAGVALPAPDRAALLSQLLS